MLFLSKERRGSYIVLDGKQRLLSIRQFAAEDGDTVYETLKLTGLDVRKDLKGKKVVINVFPSLDTAVCAASVRRFNKEAASLPNTVVLAVSKDLPFAQGRFCTTEGIDKVIPLSAFRCSCFENGYGMLMVDGPLKGLLARGVIVVDEAGKVVYEELVSEITNEPNYEAAIASLKN